MIRPTLTAAAATAVLAVPAAARKKASTTPHPRSGKPSLCERAHELRGKVVKRHGKRAPGRDICRFGYRAKARVVMVRGRDGEWAKRVKARYVRHLHALVRPPVMAAVPPPQPPAGTLSRSSGYAIPSSIVQCESGGDYRAVNTSNPDRPAGAYQVITSTWHAYGGGQYAPTADAATPAQQDAIAAKIYAGGAGRGHWAC